MSLPVFALDGPCQQLPVVGSQVQVTGPEAHHALRVRRLRIGQQVQLVDGHGVRITGTVAPAGEGSVFSQGPHLTVSVQQCVRLPAADPQLVIVQALPKGDRGWQAVQMLTEVGVDVIVPWAASRCVTRWEGQRGHKALHRWVSCAHEASKQSRRAWHPQVAPLASTNQVRQILQEATLGVVLHEQARTPLHRHLVDHLPLPSTPGASRGNNPGHNTAGRNTAGTITSEVAHCVIVVGPEGGITEQELEVFTTQGAQVAACRLGPTVLRTSTAGVVAAGIIASYARWQQPSADG